MDDDLKQREEAKRERHWDAVERWKTLCEIIAWADAQQPVPRNSKESCLARQARHRLRDAPPVEASRNMTRGE